jgi:hypothetical protein
MPFNSSTVHSNHDDKKHAYRGTIAMGSIDECDERDEADEHVDLLLRGAELFGHPGADEQGAEVAAVLARRDERVAPPQSATELIERAPRGLPPHEVREFELLQQAADDLHVLRHPAARVTVAACRQRGLHDHGHQPEQVHAHKLRHVRRLPERAPQSSRAVRQARHGCCSLFNTGG